ncbi:hypothetical protein KM043_016983 [Ampulex compressa]|nr:hypothetical protein KM043_016983 [Ampulex compressa]
MTTGRQHRSTGGMHVKSEIPRWPDPSVLISSGIVIGPQSANASPPAFAVEIHNGAERFLLVEQRAGTKRNPTCGASCTDALLGPSSSGRENLFPERLASTSLFMRIVLKFDSLLGRFRMRSKKFHFSGAGRGIFAW